MKKEQIKLIFGGTYEKAAKALGLDKSSISCWGDVLTNAQVDRVRGAAVRLGVYRPDLFPQPQPSDKEVSNV
jgi:hypothetical protein